MVESIYFLKPAWCGSHPAGLWPEQGLQPVTRSHRLQAVVCHSFSSANKLNLRYFWDDFTVRQNAALPAFNSANNWVTHNATLNDTHIFSPAVVNTFNFTFARNTFIRSPLVTSPAKNWADLGC